MRISVRHFILSSASLALMTGCSPHFATNWLANGHSYEDDTPITSSAPTDPWLDEAVITSADKMSSSTAAWQGAVFELMDKFAASIPAGSGPVYLEARSPATTQKQTFDHYLRQALLQRGFILASAKGAGPVVTYDILSLENPEVKAWTIKRLGKAAAPGRNMKDMYLLRATAYGADGKVAGDEAVVAVLTGEKVEYNRWPGYSNLPTQGKALERRPVYERD